MQRVRCTLGVLACFRATALRNVRAMPHTPGYTLRLNAARWFALRKAAGLDADAHIAVVMGIHRNNVRLVQSGAQSPSAQFVGGALAALNWPPGGVGRDPRCLFVVEAASG